MTLALAWSATVKRRKPSPPRDYATDAKASMRPTPEREIKGRFVSEPIYAHATDGDGTVLTKRTVETRRRRDADADLRNLGRRFPKLMPHHIVAAVIFEGDYCAADLEPRITADLERGGGAKRSTTFWYGDLREGIIDARDDVHYAREALRLAGTEAVRIIEAIVLQGKSSREAGAERHANERAAAAHVAASLEGGLSMLASHYAAIHPPRWPTPRLTLAKKPGGLPRVALIRGDNALDADWLPVDQAAHTGPFDPPVVSEDDLRDALERLRASAANRRDRAA